MMHKSDWTVIIEGMQKPDNRTGSMEGENESEAFHLLTWFQLLITEYITAISAN